MEEYTTNRDRLTPSVHPDPGQEDEFSDDQDQAQDQDGAKVPSDERKRDKLKRHGKNIRQSWFKTADKASDGQSSVQDRLLEKYDKISPPSAGS